MVIILRSNDLETEPRVQKYVNFLEQKKIKYLLVGWNREKKNLKREKRIYYEKKVGYNLRKKGIIYRIYWNIFLLKKLFLYRKEYTTIHACDFDTVMPSLIMKFFKKKVVFDVFDWFSDEVKTGNKIIDFTINYLEKFAFKIADYAIICEEERKEQIGVIKDKIYVLPNIPNIVGREKDDFIEKKNLEKIKIAYVGGFYKGRGLEELISMIKKYPQKYELEIAGYGDKMIANKIKEASKNYSNINYHGSVPYEKGLSIMGSSNVIYGMYYTINRNHIFAAPNKYYESIFLEKPILTNSGTILAKKVKDLKTGFVIGEGEVNLDNFLESLNKKEIKNLEKNLDDLWENKYQNYVKNFLEKEYSEILWSGTKK